MDYKSKYLMNNHSGNDYMNHNLQNNIFYKKYIKYKKKYLDLKNSEFFGGNLKSAKRYFTNFLNQEKNKETYELIVKDLKDKLNFTTENPDDLFQKIVEGTDDKNVDDFVRIYLKQQMGNPSTIENRDQFLESFNKLKILRDNRKFIIRNLNLYFKIPTTFKSLTHLKIYIKENDEIFKNIEENKKRKEKKKTEHLKIKQYGSVYFDCCNMTGQLFIFSLFSGLFS